MKKTPANFRKDLNEELWPERNKNKSLQQKCEMYLNQDVLSEKTTHIDPVIFDKLKMNLNS